MSTSLRDYCRGRWKEILPSLGIDARHLTGRHGPCPQCGGRDRFRFDNKDGAGTWICSKCGSGDGIALAMMVKGWDFKEAAEELRPVASRSAVSLPNARKQSAEGLRRAMNDLWRHAQAVTDGDAVARYLESRAIRPGSFSAEIRFSKACPYRSNGVSHGNHPAMLARFRSPDGTPSTIHKTYLTDFGEKAAVPEPRLLMPGPVAKGGAVRLAPAAPVLGVAEGIETALSASAIWGVPCWACLTAGLLMQWEPPEDVAEIIVFGDNDESYAGHQASYALAYRLKASNRKVRVEMPGDPGLDWNDVLQAERSAA